MADYLLSEASIGLEDKHKIFSIRCRTNPIGANIGKHQYCYTQCGEILPEKGFGSWSAWSFAEKWWILWMITFLLSYIKKSVTWNETVNCCS